MDLRRWLRKKKQEPVEPPVPPEPPTRAVITTGLFHEWGKKPFVYDGLVGNSYLEVSVNQIGYITICISYSGTIDIQDNNKPIVHIEVAYYTTEYHTASTSCRTTIYDAAYSDRLDGYIEALRAAIKERDDAIEAKHKRELTQF